MIMCIEAHWNPQYYVVLRLIHMVYVSCMPSSYV